MVALTDFASRKDAMMQSFYLLISKWLSFS